jgi:hypothetical protein
MNKKDDNILSVKDKITIIKEILGIKVSQVTVFDIPSTISLKMEEDDKKRFKIDKDFLAKIIKREKLKVKKYLKDTYRLYKNRHKIYAQKRWCLDKIYRNINIKENFEKEHKLNDLIEKIKRRKKIKNELKKLETGRQNYDIITAFGEYKYSDKFLSKPRSTTNILKKFIKLVEKDSRIYGRLFSEKQKEAHTKIINTLKWHIDIFNTESKDDLYYMLDNPPEDVSNIVVTAYIFTFHIKLDIPAI